MELLGLEKNECIEILNGPTTAKFDNSVIVVHIKKRIVMVCLLTDEIDELSIDKELIKLDLILKAIYFANLSQIKVKFISLVGILVCKNIDSIFDLEKFQHTNFNDFINLQPLIMTRTEWNGAEPLINSCVNKIIGNIKNNCPGN